MLPICMYDNPVLRKKSNLVENNKNLDKLIAEMFETMRMEGGCGLAAPQIGKNIMLFIAEYPDNNKKMVKKTFINPKFSIVENSTYSSLSEGCLSIPNIRVAVERADTILVEYFDQQWILRKEKLEKFPARIFQHEYDHLIGKLITDYVRPEKFKELKKTLKKLFL